MSSKLQGLEPSREQHLPQISYFAIHYKESQIVPWGEISYFAQFSVLPLGIKFNFPPKVCCEKEKKINIGFLSRGGSVTHLKEGDGGGQGGD